MREEASSNIERCGDAQLQRELDALESKWADFLSAETQKKAAMPETSGQADNAAHGGSGAEDVSPPSEPARRPSRARLAEW